MRSTLAGDQRVTDITARKYWTKLGGKWLSSDQHSSLLYHLITLVKRFIV